VTNQRWVSVVRRGAGRKRNEVRQFPAVLILAMSTTSKFDGRPQRLEVPVGDVQVDHRRSLDHLPL